MNKEVEFDVMARGYYVCTLRMPVKEGKKLDMNEVMAYVLEKRPTLKHEKIKLCFRDIEVEWSSKTVNRRKCYK